MPAPSSSHRPYVSRRKRRRSTEDIPLLSNRSMLGLLGLLVLGLLVSLGVIAAHMANPESANALEQPQSEAPAPNLVSR